MTAPAPLRQLLRRFMSLVLLLGVVASCTDTGGSPVAPPGGTGTMRLLLQPSLSSALTCVGGQPIERIRLRAISDPGGDSVHTQVFDVSPTAENWSLTLQFAVPDGVTRVVVQMELISIAGGVEVVQCSGLTAPIPVDVTETSQAAPLVLFDGPADNLRATSVTITTPVPALSEGDSIRLAAQIAGPGSPRVFWRTLDADVASVRADGTVRVLRNGSARIVAEVGLVADTVVFAAAARPASIRILQASLTAASLNEEPIFAAEVLDPRGAVIPGAVLTWTIDNAAVAQSLGGGRFRALANGSATVRATSPGNAAVTATAALLVQQRAARLAITPGSIAGRSIGDTLRFSAQVLDAGGSPMTGVPITWVSGDEATARSLGGGEFLTQRNGSTNVRATSAADPSITATAELTVAQEVAAVVVNPASYVFTAVGLAAPFTAQARDARGNVVTGAPIVWSSSADAIVTVTAAGVATARAAGDASLIARSGTAEGRAQVRVAQAAARLALAPATSLLEAVGDEVVIAASAFDANGNPIAAPAPVWTTSNAGVATVDATGRVTATGNGSAVVTAALDGVSATSAVTVRQRVATVALAPATQRATSIGEQLTYVATARDSRGVLVPSPAFEWSSADEAVAESVGSGVYRSTGNGTTEVSARAVGTDVVGRASIVVEQAISRVVVTPAVFAFSGIGLTAEFSADVQDALGVTVPNVGIVWSSADPAVATIDANGVATSRAAGTTTITARAATGQTGSATVSVQRSAVRLAIEPAELSLPRIGATASLTLHAFDGADEPIDAPAHTWVSGNSAVATVDATGRVTATGVGTTTIVATAGALTATATVVVAEPRLTVTPAALDFTGIGSSLQIEAVVRDGAGSPVDGGSITYASADPGIASADADGTVTSHSAGSTSVTVRFLTQAVVVPVTVRQEPASLTLTPSAVNLQQGGQLTLQAAVFDAAGSPIAGLNPVFASGDAAIVTVDPSGTVTGVAPGVAQVTATLGTLVAVAEITVTHGLPDLLFENIELGPTGTLTIGAQSTLTITVRSANAAAPEGTGRVLVYSGATNNIIAVAPFAHPAIPANGTVDVERLLIPEPGWPSAVYARFVLDENSLIAESNEDNNTARFPMEGSIPVVDAGDAYVEIIPATGHISAIGGTLALEAGVYSGPGTPVEVTPVWTSGNSSIATVSSAGLVTATGTGIVRIIATATVGSVIRADTAFIAVGPYDIPEDVTTIWLAPDAADYAAWSNAAYWSTGVVPAAGDVVLVPDCYAYGLSSCTYPQLTSATTIAGFRTGFESYCDGGSGTGFRSSPALQSQTCGGRIAAPERLQAPAPREAGRARTPHPAPATAANRISSSDGAYHLDLNGHTLRVNGAIPDMTYLGSVSIPALLILGGSAGDRVTGQLHTDVSVVGDVELYNAYIGGDLVVSGAAGVYGYSEGDVQVMPGGRLEVLTGFTGYGDFDIQGELIVAQGGLAAYGDMLLEGEDARLAVDGYYVWMSGGLHVIDGTVSIDALGGVQAGAYMRFSGSTAMLDVADGWAETGDYDGGVDEDVAGGPAAGMPVESTFMLTSGARLTMTEDGSYVDVRGDAWIDGGSTQGLLTAGEFYVYGDLTVGASPYAWAPSGAHTTGFGTVYADEHMVTFANPGATGGASHFHHLDVGYYSSLSLQTAAFVNGNAAFHTHESALANEGDQITVQGSLSIVYPESYSIDNTAVYGPIYLTNNDDLETNLAVRGSHILPYNLELTGNLIVEGAGVEAQADYNADVTGNLLVRDGALLTIKQVDFTVLGGVQTLTGGRLALPYEESQLDVHGAVSLGGANAISGIGRVSTRTGLTAPVANTFAPGSAIFVHLSPVDDEVPATISVASGNQIGILGLSGSVTMTGELRVNELRNSPGVTLRSTAGGDIRAEHAQISGLSIRNRLRLELGSLTGQPEISINGLDFDEYQATDTRLVLRLNGQVANISNLAFGANQAPASQAGTVLNAYGTGTANITSSMSYSDAVPRVFRASGFIVNWNGQGIGACPTSTYANIGDPVAGEFTEADCMAQGRRFRQYYFNADHQATVRMDLSSPSQPFMQMEGSGTYFATLAMHAPGVANHGYAIMNAGPHTMIFAGAAGGALGTFTFDWEETTIDGCTQTGSSDSGNVMLEVGVDYTGAITATDCPVAFDGDTYYDDYFWVWLTAGQTYQFNATGSVAWYTEVLRAGTSLAVDQGDNTTSIALTPTVTAWHRITQSTYDPGTGTYAASVELGGGDTGISTPAPAAGRTRPRPAPRGWSAPPAPGPQPPADRGITR